MRLLLALAAFVFGFVQPTFARTMTRSIPKQFNRFVR